MPTKITYNGKTTEVSAGDIATIACKDYKMATDVVVEAPESEGESAKLYGIEVTPTKAIQNVLPEGGYDGFNEVIVNAIPDEYVIPNLIIKTITENGTYKASEEVDIVGTWVFNDVIDTNSPYLWEVEFTNDNINIGECKSLGNYIFNEGSEEGYEQGYLNYTKINGTGSVVYIKNKWSASVFKTIHITSQNVNTIHGGDFYTWLKANATKTANATTVDGYSEVTVNVEPTLEELTATANGEYTPSGDGYSKVTVNVASEEVEEWDGSGVVIEEIATEDETDSVVGTWLFNSSIPAFAASYDVNFISAGSKYTNLFGDGEFYMFYDDTIVYDWLDKVWAEDAYRTINITSEPTDTAFIEWLKANATKQ